MPGQDSLYIYVVCEPCGLAEVRFLWRLSGTMYAQFGQSAVAGLGRLVCTLQSHFSKRFAAGLLAPYTHCVAASLLQARPKQPAELVPPEAAPPAAADEQGPPLE